MKKILFSTLLILTVSLSTLFYTPSSSAAPSAKSFSRAKGFGLGLEIGTIDAITGKYVLANGNAVDFGFAFWMMPWNAIYGDYIFNFPGLFGASTPFLRQTIGYLGVGGGLSFWSGPICSRYYCGSLYTSSGTGVFIRGFFGAEWYAGQAPFGVFAELGPTIGIVPGFGSGLDLGIGGRYFF
jgi:hypothetical protein